MLYFLVQKQICLLKPSVSFLWEGLRWLTAVGREKFQKT